MKYSNPIIPGMYPDPSICAVGEDFYLINSTFEYFPAIPIFHSTDLVHWEQIGHCIDRPDQLKLRVGFPNRTGIYAPTIRYHEGRFYIITTNVAYGGEDEGNFIISAASPEGPWSDPVFLDFPGIDPSLFFDEDGKAYYIGTFQKIFVCEIDPDTGEKKGEMKQIWGGTGGNDPEGPHIYKKDGWYYLLISEGGTEYGHMITMARSRDIMGPYEACPHNPVLTNRSTSFDIKAVGHADLVETADHQWWAVCLGIRSIGYPYKYSLGRETNLVPVTWGEDGWPVFGGDGHLRTNIVTSQEDGEPEFVTGKFDSISKDTFMEAVLDKKWNTIYNPVEGLFETGNGLILHGNEIPLSSAEPKAWLGRRQQHHAFRAVTVLDFSPSQEGEEAGLTIYMNPLHHYEVAVKHIDGENRVIVHRQIGSLHKVENSIPVQVEKTKLEIRAEGEWFYLGIRDEKDDFVEIGKGETAYITTEVGGMFTGNYLGLYASGNGKVCQTAAVFERFVYEPIL